MKVSTAVAAIAASAALASASPLRVIVVSSNANGQALPRPEPFINMRLGHGIPPPPNGDLAHMLAHHPGAQAAPGILTPVASMNSVHMPHKPCGGSRFRAKFNQKAIEVANSFRKVFGLPLIDVAHDPATHKHHGMHKIPVEMQIVPIHGNGGSTIIKMDHNSMKMGMGGGERGWWGHTQGGEKVHIVTAPGHHVHHNHHGMRIMHPTLVPNGFFARFTSAIMSLGPWEGRAVAFVIGAGIGVLLRMFWVLGVLVFRGASGKNVNGRGYEAVGAEDSDDDEDDVVTPRRGTPLSAPPQYIYPVDEKIVYAQEVTKAPAPAPASN